MKDKIKKNINENTKSDEIKKKIKIINAMMNLKQI